MGEERRGEEDGVMDTWCKTSVYKRREGEEEGDVGGSCETCCQRAV